MIGVRGDAAESTGGLSGMNVRAPSKIRSRDLAGAVCAVALVGGVLAGMPTASATEHRSNGEDPIKVLDSVVTSGMVGYDTTTHKQIVTEPLKAITNLVDAATGAILGKSALKFSVSDSGGDPLGAYACSLKGSTKDLTAYAPHNRWVSGRAGHIHFQYHPYERVNARKLGGHDTTQWEVCSTGGGDLGKGWRLFQVGTGMSVDDKTNFHKIGQRWAEEKTPKDLSLGIGFEVAKGPVTITGSLGQTPNDKLTGSMVGPFKSYMDDYAKNGVNAWWEDGCMDNPFGCFSGDGSPNFQGATAHGLWEYPTATIPKRLMFHFTPYYTFKCQGFWKCG